MNRPACSWILCSSFVLALGVVLSVLPLQAQVDTGSITGTVSDSSGAVVSGAKVTLTNEGTAASLSTATGSDGLYRFSPVRIGNYKIDVAAEGFKTATEIHIAVDVSSNVTRNFKLQPGKVSERIEVTAEAPLLQSEDASVGQVVNQKNVNDLPLNGRNFTFLAQLAAGVNSPQADTRGNAASGAFSANGLRPAQNNYMLDGIDNNSDTVDFLNGTNYVVLPPVDAVQEFKVQTSDFSAELGRSAGAVLNATIKSGTNEFHGAAWEFFRNDKLDAADYFEDAKGIPKGELRQNQFGFSAGGPVIKNKIFIFGDYEGFRRVQGTIQTGTVPTVADRTSGYTNLADIISQPGSIANCAASGARCDDLGRVIPGGTILDPATTRPVTKGSVDSVTGLAAISSGFVRDPFSKCPANTTNFSTAGCTTGLNQLPAGRLDSNAIALLNLFPAPTTGAVSGNFASSRPLYEHRNSFDTRMDVNFNQANQMFFRFSYVDDPQYIPGIFGGIADGGAFQQGIQTALAQQSALAYTHVFSPTVVNVARVGLNYLHTTRTGPEGAASANIPSQFGIQGIPQGNLNGGLPAIGFGGLNTLGSNSFLPSDETSQTLQFTDDFTKIYGKHSFKMGVEYQHIHFGTLQPAWSRGQFNYGGGFTDISANNGSNTGIAQFLLTPTTSTVAGGVDYVGGADSVFASNISKTNDAKNYFASYFQDDWKMNTKLTLNLGLRWDWFGLIYEQHGRQANWVPYGPPNHSPMYLLPGNVDQSTLSASFTNQLAADNIQLKIGGYGLGLGNPQKTNFAPRIGFAYQATPKLVARGGFGIFYNAFENQGYGPNDGENYPFVFNFSWFNTNDWTSIGLDPVQNPNPWTGCATAGPGGVATLSSGFSCIGLTPSAVNASGLGLQGLSFDFITPYTLSTNLTLQYQIQPTLSVQAGWVNTEARHLQIGLGANSVAQILPSGASTTPYIPFPGFGGGSYQATVGSSSYNGLQTKLEKTFSGGLNFLLTYTWSKAFSDAADELNGGSIGGGNGYRGAYIPGFGISKDRGLADFDIRNVVHFSGGYALPFGKGKKFMGNAGSIANAVIGGWSLNWITTLQGGQPITIGCPNGTTAGTNCTALPVPGQSQKLGLHIDSNGQLSWFGNPGAFTQPCVLGGTPGNTVPTSSPSGCVPLNGVGALGGGPSQTRAPGFHRLDFSAFKDFRISERFLVQFRAELFNVFNHPNFNAPGFGGNGVVSVPNATNFYNSNFGEIGSTRDAPYDPRQIQFALKLYF